MRMRMHTQIPLLPRPSACHRFQPIDWAALDRREIKPSFIPSVSGELDVSNFDEEFTTQSTRDSVATDLAALPKTNKAPANFDGFTYVDTGHLNLT